MAEYCSQCCSHKYKRPDANVSSELIGAARNASDRGATQLDVGSHISEGLAKLSVTQSGSDHSSAQAFDEADALPCSLLPENPVIENLEIEKLKSTEKCEKDCDIFLVGREGDELLYKLREFLVHWISHTEGRALRVLLEEDLYPHSTEKLDLIERAIQRSHRFFVLHSGTDSQQTSESSNLWYRFTRSQALVNHILQSADIVVVKEKESTVADGFFANFIGVTLSRLFNGNDLRSCDNVKLIAPEHLNRRELDRLQTLCSAQSSTRQVIPVNNGPSTPGQPTLKGLIIEKGFHHLAGCIDPENGLLGNLFSREVIDIREFDRLRKALKSNSYVEVNEELLRKLIWLNEVKIEAFVQALVETNQSHVVEYLNTLPASG